MSYPSERWSKGKDLNLRNGRLSSACLKPLDDPWMEPTKGIEPLSLPYEGSILPLNEAGSERFNRPSQPRPLYQGTVFEVPLSGTRCLLGLVDGVGNDPTTSRLRVGYSGQLSYPSVGRVGVEPTNSLGSRPSGFASLPTRRISILERAPGYDPSTSGFAGQ